MKVIDYKVDRIAGLARWIANEMKCEWNELQMSGVYTYIGRLAEALKKKWKASLSFKKDNKLLFKSFVKRLLYLLSKGFFWDPQWIANEMNCKWVLCIIRLQNKWFCSNIFWQESWKQSWSFFQDYFSRLFCKNL